MNQAKWCISPLAAECCQHHSQLLELFLSWSSIINRGSSPAAAWGTLESASGVDRTSWILPLTSFKGEGLSEVARLRWPPLPGLPGWETHWQRETCCCAPGTRSSVMRVGPLSPLMSPSCRYISCSPQVDALRRLRWHTGTKVSS